MATKKYESMRIMSLEGSVLCKNEGFTATKDGKPDPNVFRGILDESLDTLVLSSIFRKFVSDKMKQCAGTPAMERLRSAYLP